MLGNDAKCYQEIEILLNCNLRKPLQVLRADYVDEKSSPAGRHCVSVTTVNYININPWNFAQIQKLLLSF